MGVIFLTSLAYWHRDVILYAIDGAAILGFAVMFIPTNKFIAGVLFVLGVYTLIKAVWDKKR